MSSIAGCRGQISPAILFFNGTFRTIGDIGIRDCVVFDEVSRIKFQNPDEMMGKLEDLESGELWNLSKFEKWGVCFLVYSSTRRLNVTLTE